jgi:quercetin dioxygenase-like cupin family protein
MTAIKKLNDHVGSRPEKFFKSTLFRSDAMLLGLNCLEPGQVQKPHDHSDQDKFYYVVEGEGHFWLGEDQIVVGAGNVVWAAAGVVHGVKNEGQGRLTLLVGIAPAP